MKFTRRPVRALLRPALLVVVVGTGALSLRPALRSTSAQNAPAVKPAIPTAETRKDEYMGMYLGKDRIGYQHLHVEPATFNGKPALRVTTQGVTKITVFGTTVEEVESSETLTDLKYQPLTQTLDVKSNGSAIHLQATYDYAARTIVCQSGTGSDASRKTLAIPPGANLAADTSLLTEGQKLVVGKKLTFYYLNPLTIDLQQAEVEVTGRETIADPVTGKNVSTFVTKTALPIGEATEWSSEAGDTLKSEVGIAGISIVSLRETKRAQDAAEGKTGSRTPNTNVAGSKTYTPPADFALATSVRADRIIANPRTLKRLDAVVVGIPDKRYVLSDTRQQADIEPRREEGKEKRAENAAGEAEAKPEAGLRAHMVIQAANPDGVYTASLPVTQPDLLPYTIKTAYLDSEDAALRASAQKVRGNETNLYRVAIKLRDWVHEQMTPDLSIGVPRTATDIFHRPRGVCRDYATLYTAMARSIGLPTRLCSGIVYAEGRDGEPGRFFYHAWVESWVGQWVAFDPTLYDPSHPVNYVDATHIKFAQGDVIEMFNVVGVIGKLRVIVHSAS